MTDWCVRAARKLAPLFSCTVAGWCSLSVQAAPPLTLYETDFEAVSGFDPAFTLAGQQGWVGTPGTQTVANGLVDDPFVGPTQMAYVGFFPLNNGFSSLNLWRPINFSPVPLERSVVKFNVTLNVIDSENLRYDCFRWSAYNTAGQRLFSLDFDNLDLGINVNLQGSTNFVFTGERFINSVPLNLEVTMDLVQNRWGATADGFTLTNGAPITTTNSTLDLGHIDAVWVHRSVGLPGDNFMAFDDYRVVAQSPPAPEVKALGRTNGQFLLRLNGEPGRNYAIEASTNLTQWTALRTNVAVGGTFDLLDTGSANLPRRFYRGRLVR